MTDTDVRIKLTTQAVDTFLHRPGALYLTNERNLYTSLSCEEQRLCLSDSVVLVLCECFVDGEERIIEEGATVLGTM